MLGILGFASQVGIYSMSAFIGHQIDFFQRMFNNIFSPMISDLYNQGKRSEMIRLFQTVSKWTLLLTLPVFFTFVFLGYAILELFGREFHAGWATLIVLSLGTLINVGVGPVGSMLLMTGRPGLELINGWIAGLSNIALNLWLIPRYGAFGAALATAMSVAMLNLIRLWQVYRIHRCYPFRTSTFKVLAAFAISAGAMWLLAHLYHFALGGKLACMAGFLAIYAGLLFAFGRDEEDQFVIDRLKRRFGQLRG
jgi:O-antigen/teichoic acid export membrane protein